MVTPEIRAALDRSVAAGDSPAVFHLLIDHFHAAKNFTALFETRLMQKRLQLGLPLIQTEDSSDLPEETRAAYDRGITEAARETGTLFLGEGNIERAWPYFRAIGEQGPIIEAIDKFQPKDATPEAVAVAIAIAFQEGLHPAKGLALILESQGMCRAITTFGMFDVRQDREACIALMVRGVYDEIVERMGRAIEAEEGSAPERASLDTLMANRDYLFGEYDSYVDNSHLSTLLPYSVEVSSPDTLALYQQLCEYGKRLSSQFQLRGEPPFANPYRDYGFYIQALRGIRPEEAVAHFREMVAGEPGPAPAQVLVNLLVRLRRPAEALDVSLEYLDPGSAGPCPSAVQLCFLAKDFARLQELAMEQEDLVSYTAARLSTL